MSRSSSQAIAVGRPVTRPPPAQIPACGMTAPGSATCFACARGVSASRGRSGARWRRNAWSCHGALLQPVRASRPGIPGRLPPAMPPWVQPPRAVGEARGTARRVAAPPSVLGLPTAWTLACLPQGRQARVPRLVDPGGAGAPRVLPPRPCGPTREPSLAGAVRAPHTRQAQEVQATWGVVRGPPAPQPSRRLRGPLEALWPEPLAAPPGATRGSPRRLAGTDTVLGLVTPEGRACARRGTRACRP